MATKVVSIVLVVTIVLATISSCKGIGRVARYIPIPIPGITSSIENCDDLAPQIIELSEENEGPFSSRILKLYDIDEVRNYIRNDNTSVRSTTYLLLCTATAKLNRGDDTEIRFYVEADSDGDWFIGYEQQEP